MSALKRSPSSLIKSFVFLFCVPALFFGQQNPNPRVTLFGGGSFLKAERIFTADGEPFRSNFVRGGKFGARGTVDIAPRWAVEGAYSYGTNNLRMFELEPPPLLRVFGVRIHQLSANALYFLNQSPGKVRLFATAGVGLARYAPTSAAKVLAATVAFVDQPATISGSNKFDFNWGGGVEAKVSGRWGLRFDFRDHITGFPRFGVPQVNLGADFFPVSGHVNDLETSLGIVFHLK